LEKASKQDFDTKQQAQQF